MLNTVKVPKQFEPIFQKAQEYVSRYFKKRKEDPSKGTIEIFGERYILVRAASMSIDFFETIKKLYKDQGKEEAFNVARQLLFDIAHAIGKQDAKNFHKKMELKDPIEKLSAGPVHFSHSGWAFVDIFAESRPAPDESYYLIYDHPFSFESDAWMKSGRKSDFPVCVMNAGYSSGWCEESFGLPLVASEIMCRAKGDDACRFIMAHPSKIEGYIGNYLKKEPKLAKKITKYEIPGFFKRKEMEKALQESEEKYRAFFNTAKDGIFINDETGKFTDVNLAACESLGYSKEELLKLSNKEIDLGTVGYEASQKVRDTSAQKVMFEVHQKRKDGSFLPVEITETFFSVGSQRFSLLIARDITERKRAEKALLKANEELEQRVKERTAELAKALNEQKNIMDTIPDIIYLLDMSGKLVKWNKRVEIITGFSSKELMGKYVLEFFPEQDKIAITKSIQEAFEKGFTEVEGHLLRKDGAIVPYEWTGVPYKDEQDNVIGLIGVGRDITERKRAEAEREKLLQDLSERVKELRCIADLSRLAEIQWSSIKEFVQRVVSILPPAWKYPEICSARITLDSEEFKTTNFRETEWCQSADIKVDGKKFGTVTVCYLEEKPAADEGPFLKEERSLINTVADFLGHIIQHRQIEAEIRDSEAKFRTIFDNANDGMLLADIENKKFHSGNAAICRMLGYSQEEIKNIGIMDIHPEKDIPYIIEQFEKQTRKEITLAHDLPVKRKDGSVFYADVNSALVEISGKRYLLGIFRDTTERMKAEEELRKTRDYLEKLLNYANAPIIVWDTKSIITSFNHAFERLTGYTNKEVIGKTLHILFPEASKEESLEKIGLTLSGEYWESVEIPVLCKDGSIRIALWNSANIYAKDAVTLIATVAQGQDITERKRAELMRFRSLERQERMNQLQQDLLAPGEMWGKLKRITDSVVDIFGADFCRVWVIGDGDLCEIGCIHAAVKEGPHICVRRDKCLRLMASSGRYTHTDGGHRRVPLGAYKIGRVASGQEHKFLTNDVTHDPGVHNHDWARGLGLVSSAGYQLRPSGGETLGVIALFSTHAITAEEDIQLDALSSTTAQVIRACKIEEEIRKLNEELEQRVIQRTAELEAANRELESFSYSVSHDLRAPVRALGGFSSILLEDHADKLDDEGKHLLNTIRSSAEKMRGLIDSLLDLSRIGRKDIKLSDIDVDKLAKAVFDEIKATTPERELQFNIKPLPPARGDEGMIRQVFFNLLYNAIKFTKPKETAIIEIGGCVEGFENVYYVKDNGVGFDMQYADKLFGAFQRLHSGKEFEGTGIGLAIVQRVINRHGGRVWAEGKVNEGATFHFTIPKVVG